MKKVLYIFLIILLPSQSFSQPPEKIDNPFEFTQNQYCNDRNISKRVLRKLIEKAENKDTLALYFLYFSYKSFDENMLPKRTEIFKSLLETGNPYAAIIMGYEAIIKEENLNKAVFWLEFAAKLNIPEAIDFLIVIYSGEKFPQYKNLELMKYWSKQDALLGIIYGLKSYKFSNTAQLSKAELVPWDVAYDIIIKKKGYKQKMEDASIETKWILREFNNNRKNLRVTLKKFHPWYGNFKYCKKE